MTYYLIICTYYLLIMRYYLIISTYYLIIITYYLIISTYYLIIMRYLIITTERGVTGGKGGICEQTYSGPGCIPSVKVNIISEE